VKKQQGKGKILLGRFIRFGFTEEFSGIYLLVVLSVTILQAPVRI
jgi:hypothetical protein